MKLIHRLLALFRRGKLDREMDVELRAHLERETEQNISRGLSPDEARFAARRAFGGLDQLKERERDVRGWRWVAELARDFRHAVRQLAKSPGFTAVAILTLALGIGATTSIFTVVDTVLWRSLPYANPDQLVEFRTVLDSNRELGLHWPVESLSAWRDQPQLFAQVEAHAGRTMVVSGGGEPRDVGVLAVTPGLFQLLGRAPETGRPFLPADVETGSPGVAIVSHAYWQQQLGGQPLTSEVTINLDDQPYTVIAAMPAGFAFPRPGYEMWIPLSTTTKANAVATPPVDIVARLRPGLDIPSANRDFAPLAARMIEEGFMPQNGAGVRAHALDETRANPAPRRAMVIFMIAVALVLLIACANVANLLLVRGATRAREFAVRAALGANRLHIVRQLCTESALLAIAGAGGGLLITFWSLKFIWALAPTELTFLTVNEVAVNPRVLAVTLAVTVLTTLLCGLIPAWRACRHDPNTAFSGPSRSATTGRSQGRLHHGLIIGEVALSLVLLIGAGLMLRSFLRLSKVEPGFDPKNVAVMTIRLPRERYPTPAQQQEFYAQLEEQLATLPEVVAVTTATGIPPRAGGFFIVPSVDIEGRERQSLGQSTFLSYNTVDGDYFHTMDIPILRGRTFGRDDLPSGPASVIISQTMARLLWANENAVGQRFRFSEREPWMTVAGVAGDVRAFGLRDDRGNMEFYLPIAQQERPPAHRYVIIRTATDPGPLMTAFKSQVWALDDKLPISQLETAESVISESLAETRFYATIVGIFAGVAVMLAAIGLYGVMAYVVAQRTRELGIRLALGAQRSTVFALVLKRGLLLTLGGTTLGIAAAFALTRYLESLLFGISPHDPFTFALIALGLMGVALLACHLPARRAARVDPIEALRAE